LGSSVAQSPSSKAPKQQQQEQSGGGSSGGLPITPRSISKIVSLNDLRQLVRRMEPAPPSPVSVLPARNGEDSSSGTKTLNGTGSVSRGERVNGNGNEQKKGDEGAGAGEDGNGNGNGDATDARVTWSDGVLDVVAVLGEGASGAVEAVQDTRTGRRYARKTIVTHEGPLKQLVRELAFLSSLRHTNVVRFYGAYMSPANTEIKLVMELCEGRSLAAVGEQIRRRKGRVGEKVARVLAEEVSVVSSVPCSLFLFFSFFFRVFLTQRLAPFVPSLP
jgi:hypothetical protein